MPVPDFESGKGHHWMKMTRQAEAAGVRDKLPRKPRKGAAETDFFGQVDRRLSRRCYTMDVSIVDGRIIREEDLESVS